MGNKLAWGRGHFLWVLADGAVESVDHPVQVIIWDGQRDDGVENLRLGSCCWRGWVLSLREQHASAHQVAMAGSGESPVMAV